MHKLKLFLEEFILPCMYEKHNHFNEKYSVGLNAQVDLKWKWKKSPISDSGSAHVGM